jgi:citrate lyase subunit beta/citryl-CoA lyase
VIHPAQIPVVDEVFSPTKEEVEQARGVLAALDEAARNGGRGVAVVEGAMVDEASRRLAEGVVERARAAGITQ